MHIAGRGVRTRSTCRTSAAIPTTVSHGIRGLSGAPGLIRLPIACCSGQNVRAIVSLTTIDGCVVLVSLQATSRPSRTGIDIAPKYPGETVRKSTMRICPGAGGG